MQRNGPEAAFVFVGACDHRHTNVSLQVASPVSRGGETEGTTTDENLNAWYDFFGNENADECAWQFGTTFPGINGAQANAAIGGKDFLIQLNWVDASDAAGNPIGCRNHWP